MWKLLGADDIGITLTESLAMHPAASVSGLYFSHPASTYFSTGKITRQQVSQQATGLNICFAFVILRIMMMMQLRLCAVRLVL